MDILVNGGLQKYKLWPELPSAEISPEGDNRVYFGDIWKIIVQADERQRQDGTCLLCWKSYGVRELIAEGKGLLLLWLLGEEG